MATDRETYLPLCMAGRPVRTISLSDARLVEALDFSNLERRVIATVGERFVKDRVDEHIAEHGVESLLVFDSLAQFIHETVLECGMLYGHDAFTHKLPPLGFLAGFDIRTPSVKNAIDCNRTEKYAKSYPSYSRMRVSYQLEGFDPLKHLEPKHTASDAGMMYLNGKLRARSIYTPPEPFTTLLASPTFAEPVIHQQYSLPLLKAKSWKTKNSRR